MAISRAVRRGWAQSMAPCANLSSGLRSILTGYPNPGTRNRAAAPALQKFYIGHAISVLFDVKPTGTDSCCRHAVRRGSGGSRFALLLLLFRDEIAAKTSATPMGTLSLGSRPTPITHNPRQPRALYSSPSGVLPSSMHWHAQWHPVASSGMEVLVVVAPVAVVLWACALEELEVGAGAFEA